MKLSNDSRRLGAIIAGGRARRFGSDKGAALLGGVALIDHAAATLRPWVAEVIVVGRDWPGLRSVKDRPAPDLGPLGGINAALHAAAGYDAVLTIGGDMPRVPAALLEALIAGGSLWCEAAPILGCWDVALAEQLDAYLTKGDDRSVHRWARSAGAEPVTWRPLPNVNTPSDLAAL